jgi:hypothetical protein
MKRITHSATSVGTSAQTHSSLLLKSSASVTGRISNTNIYILPRYLYSKRCCGTKHRLRNHDNSLNLANLFTYLRTTLSEDFSCVEHSRILFQKHGQTRCWKHREVKIASNTHQARPWFAALQFKGIDIISSNRSAPKLVTAGSDKGGKTKQTWTCRAPIACEGKKKQTPEYRLERLPTEPHPRTPCRR